MTAHTEAIKGGVRSKKALNHIFIQTAAHKNLQVREPGAVEEPAGFRRQMTQIARVQTNTGDTKLRTEFARQFDHVTDSLKRVVRVHQQNRFRKAADKTPERFQFGLTRLNVAMRHGTGYRTAIYLARTNVRLHVNTSDVKSPRFLSSMMCPVHRPAAQGHDRDR